MKDSLNVSILCASQIDASDVTGRYSRFQGKMTIFGHQFRDSLQFMHGKNARIMPSFEPNHGL